MLISSVAREVLRRQIFNFRSDDGKSLARIAGTRSFNRRVERQQVSLVGNIADQLDDVADLKRRIRQRMHQTAGTLGLLDGMFGNVG